MTPSTQVKLLRVLQEKCVQRLGGRETIPVDVRVLAATHHDLEAAIGDKLFREDLYYRLNVVMITLPPLRQRKEDIPELVRYFLTKYGPELGHPSPSIHADAMEFLQSHSWHGNVRELEMWFANPCCSPRLYRERGSRPHAVNKDVSLPASASQSLGSILAICWRRPSGVRRRRSMRACSKPPSGNCSGRPSPWRRAISQGRALAGCFPHYHESQTGSVRSHPGTENEPAT